MIAHKIPSPWRRIAASAACFAVMAGMVGAVHPSSFVHAAATAPQLHVYNGRLLTSGGVPITTAHSIRFSYWFSSDWVSSDTTGAGAINTGAPNYAGWNEVQTVTPDSNGFLSVELGSITALPDLSAYTPAQLQSLFLQVEVKAGASPDTSYEVLDVAAADPARDRSPVLSVPFALNADLLDRREIGTGSGSIPLLQSGGLLHVNTTPGGTNRDVFILDADGNASSSVGLQFGSALNKTLSFDVANDRFTFNDDVRIQGNLTVTGLINGIDLSSFSGSTADHGVEATYHPAYADVSYVADGTDNVGQLTLLNETGSNRAFYRWNTTRSTLQDYDVVLRLRLPTTFVSWESTPLAITYKSNAAASSVNKLDVSVYDSSGAAVTLGGSSTGLASTSWATTTLTFSGTPTWTPGTDIVLKLKLFAAAGGEMKIAEVAAKYRATTN